MVTVARAEEEGLAFAFWGRSLAIAAVGLWLVVLVPWPRDAYYLSLALALLAFGYVPFRLRHSHRAKVMLVFVLLDAAVVTTAVLLPPPGDFALHWPVQTRTRGPEFAYLLLLLGEAALTYSPSRVVWTGISIASSWLGGVTAIYFLPTTARSLGHTAPEGATDTDRLTAFFNPWTVNLNQALTQVVVILILTALLAAAVLRCRLHLLGQVRAETLQTDLARYVSPDVAEAISASVASGFGAPVERDVAVLFADIVGFTRLAERLDPGRGFALLRSFQERSSAVVLAHGGTIDKYLGDGLMATFGALSDDADAPGRAVACARSLMLEIERWSGKRVLRGAEPIHIAVGVHHGTVTVGHLGSDRHREFTVVGDVVNVASRLEKAARELDCTLVVSDDCMRAGRDITASTLFQRRSELHIRGRDAPIVVHLSG